MRLSSLALPLAALALGAPALAEQAPAEAAAQEDARIPFANSGGIRDWRGHDRQTLYVQDRQRHWYKATLASPSVDLRSAIEIGFDTGPSDIFDKFSVVVIEGQRYAIASLEPIEGEPPKRDEHQHDG